MAADQKDTTVTEESTQQETVATKAKPAAASKKPKALLDAKVWLTMVGGKVVYQAGAE